MSTFIKNGTIMLDTMPSVVAYGSAVGRMEGEGPLGSCFDYVSEDSTFGEGTWEKSESRLQQHAMEQALIKGKLSEGDITFAFAGDLLNQCTSSAYSMRNNGIRFFGLYGACSTMAESLALASVFADNHPGTLDLAMTSSASPDFAVDSDGKRVRDSRKSFRAALCEGSHDRHYYRYGHKGREQHGCGNGSRGSRYDKDAP